MQKKMEMNDEELLELISAGESETVEFKPSLSQTNEIVETVSAFSNTRGGKIIVGVSDSGRVLGVDGSKDVTERLTGKILNNTDPRIHPGILLKRIDEKVIIQIDIKKSLDHLVMAFGRPFRRIGKSTVKISKEEYEKTILEKHREKLRFDIGVCEDADLESIDRRKVNWYLNKRKEIRKVKKPQVLSIEQVLLNIGAAKETNDIIKPTNAGILFFGKNPQRFFARSQLRVVRFKGTRVIHPTIDRFDCVGTLWEMVEQAEEFIRRNIRLFGIRTNKSFMREDKFEYPIEALREAIINALIHRNYYEPADVRVFIFDDRVEVINPGNFPEGVTPQKPIHRPVNDILCNFMYDIGFIEKYGSGIYMMQELCKEQGNKKPYYKFHPLETKIIFESPEKEVIFREDEKLEGFEGRRNKILQFLQKYGRFTRREYVSINKISEKQANDDIEKMLKEREIERRGRGRSVFYV